MNSKPFTIDDLFDPDHFKGTNKLLKRAAEFVEFVNNIDFFPNEYYRKPMKKLIPFDIDKAKAGAKVVTNTGQAVTILTYEGRDSKRPIIGTFMHAEYVGGEGYNEAEEILDRWPIDGKNVHPGGFDLMIEEEVSEVDYEEDDLSSRVSMSTEDWLKVRERIELLEEQKKELYKDNKNLTEEVRKWGADCNAKQKRIDELMERIKMLSNANLSYYERITELSKELAGWDDVKEAFNNIGKAEEI